MGRLRALYVPRAMRMIYPKRNGTLQSHRRGIGRALAGGDSRIGPSWRQTNQNSALFGTEGHNPEWIAITVAAQAHKNPVYSLIAIVVAMASAVAGPMCCALAQWLRLDAFRAAAFGRGKAPFATK